MNDEMKKMKKKSYSSLPTKVTSKPKNYDRS